MKGNSMTTPVATPPQKSFLLTAIFAIALGVFGVDRFYLGKVGTGVIKLLTCGGAGVWWLIDVILVLAGKTVDKANQPLEGVNTKNRLIAVGVLVVMIIIGAATPKGDMSASSNNGTNNSSNSSSEPEETDEPIVEAAPTIGDTLEADGGVSVTLTDVKFESEDNLGNEADNGKFLVAYYTINNDSGDSLTVSTLLSFDVAGESGATYNTSIFGPYKTSLDSTVKDGRKLTGQIAFDVSDETTYYLTYQPRLGADEVEFEVTADQIG